MAGATKLVSGTETNLHSHPVTHIKSAWESVTEDFSAAVTFTTAFASVPNVVATPQSSDPNQSATVTDITVNGFSVYLNKPTGGGAQNIRVHWIATDVGNP
ncbi:hypothetical protein LCGC14_0420730 [marine sediment metagenome]|uniref:H-type lectin domain-containing protein n=1 Tax=marine sediment metagenome TaxID=412755 RepID=A0A0F9SX68_9ZZZZ